MAEVDAAWQNGYAERLMRTIKEEEVDVSEYKDYADSTRQLGRFLDEVYLRQQHSLVVGRVFPRLSFCQQWLAQQADPSAH
jgi:putative transposase